MSGNKLFIKRFLQQLHDQWNVIRSVLDWSIMLYIAIPAAAIAPFLYADIWRNIHSYWDTHLPVSLLLTLILLLSGRGNIRTYLMDADLLFLIQKRRQTHQLKRCGFLTSLLSLFLFEIVLFVLALPVLTQIYHYPLVQVLSLYLAVSAFKLSLMTIKKITDSVITRWLFIILAYSLADILLLTVAPALWAICSAFCSIIMIYLNVTQLKKTNRWVKDLEIESTEQTKYIKLILNFSTGIEKPSVTRRKKPLILFHRSARIFKKRTKENGLLELLLKTFLRSGPNVLSCIQLVSVTCIAVFLLPVWLKWSVYALFIWFMNVWLKILFRKMSGNVFFNVVRFDPTIADPVLLRFQRWLAVPPIIFTGIVVLLSTIYKISLR
ncbi:ABC transporter permease [Sporolactobacillus shoreae]|uniref:ABC transporter permease n=1 Tax=Sporolactobacillus shoreae TaxID=1465501 RepID=A0A4Z0GL46_9BACL|nr:ABC transporter permease [Sporolactobacillus shoreae]TGA97683.1 ABC transporter permease [Sporolactobacillus shoreae]